MTNNSRPRRQLYRHVKSVEVPTIVDLDLDTGELLQENHFLKRFYTFYWPNNTPCLPIEMYLYELSRTARISEIDGGKIGSYVTHLTHLVRYCFYASPPIDFYQLADSDVIKLMEQLAEDKDKFGVRARNNNSINTIIDTITRFLIWYQKQFFPDLKLIGVDQGRVKHRIKLKLQIVKHAHRKKPQYVETFHRKLPTQAREERSPISHRTIKELKKACLSTSEVGRVNRRMEKIFNREQVKDHLEYMQKRRELQLTLLEATGCRPREMRDISYRLNVKNLEDNTLLIPTRKREEGSSRIIEVDAATSIKITVFAEIYLKKLRIRLIYSGLVGKGFELDDGLFLDPETGKNVTPAALYQDFRRLAEKAKIPYRTFQYQFRHRFITNMVKLHLLSFTKNNPLKNRHNFMQEDYLSILKKVAARTGHKDPHSLLNYVSDAWDELEVYSDAYEVLSLQNKMKSVSEIALALKLELNGFKGDIDSLQKLISNYIDKIEHESDIFTLSMDK